MSTLKFLLQLSRPKFWLYVLGPFLVGYTATIQSLDSFLSLRFIAHFVFFLVPANIFLYGINDLFDEDTDSWNDKKGTDEILLRKNQHNLVIRALYVVAALGLGLMFFESTFTRTLLALFIFLGAAYSTPPLRFKAHPFVDFSSNILYGVPGLVGYSLLTDKLPSLLIIGAVFCWTGAMHLFSAIPDIESDRAAHLKTSAVVLGQKKSLALCAILWLGSVTALGVSQAVPQSFLLVGLIYPAIPLFLFRANRDRIKAMYRLFPYLNALVGMILFFIVMTKQQLL